jgi:nucleoside-diphosphate-sugar epimerase
MRVLITGARGKVGRAAVDALAGAGHDVVATDIAPAVFDRPPGDAPLVDRVPYVRADLTDAGDVFALVGGFTDGEGPPRGGFDAVVHAGALPAPGRHAAHVVFHNNVMGVFNVVEACVRWGVPRLVNVSSETVVGFQFAERPIWPRYLPMDEEHPCEPQDPYGLGKVVGEDLCTAAARRSDLKIISLRPTWVQDPSSYPRNLGPLLADRSLPSTNGWSYIDADDLAAAILAAVGSDVAGHEAMFIAADDNVGSRDLHAAWRGAFPDAPTELRPVPRPDMNGFDTTKAKRLLDWAPRRSWQDFLTASGEPLAR